MRWIAEEDIPWVISMLHKVADESPVYGSITRNEDYVTQYLTSLAECGMLIGVADDYDRGLMLGAIGNEWYTSDIHAHEMVLYVAPKYRATMLAPKLIRSFEELAKARGAIEVRAGATTAINDERTLNLYIRLGYERLGTGVRKIL